jgi:uncharacterized protein YkwD
MAVTGVAAVAVIGGGTAFVVSGGEKPAQVRAEPVAQPAVAAAISRALASAPVSASASARPPAASSTPQRAAARRAATPSAGARTTAAAAPAHAAAPSPTPAAAATTTAARAAAVGDSAVQQVLDLINQARAAQGLPALTLDAGLTRSAAAHNQVMASGCGLSHQCPGEAPLGQREQAQGVQWTSAGENIGEGGPVADSDQPIASMAVGLTQSMLDEKPPDDGHRRNILSSSFTRIGIAVLRDSSGTVWLTQDFAD